MRVFICDKDHPHAGAGVRLSGRSCHGVSRAGGDARSTESSGVSESESELSVLQVTPDCAGSIQRVRMTDGSDAIPGSASTDVIHELVDTNVRCPYCAGVLSHVKSESVGRTLLQEEGSIGVSLRFPVSHALLVCESCPGEPLLMFALPVDRLEKENGA